MLGHSVVGQLPLGQLTPSSTGVYFLGAETGVFTITDGATVLSYPPRLFADAGSFTLTGNDASFIYNRPVVAETGSFALTGYDVGLYRRAALTAESGSFTLSSAGASFVYSFNLTADAGAFVMTGHEVGLLLTRPKFGILAAPRGSYPIKARARYRRAVH